jgi:hypothetical protein
MIEGTSRNKLHNTSEIETTLIKNRPSIRLVGLLNIDAADGSLSRVVGGLS